MRRSRYTDQVRYIVSVLWCHGASEAVIANLLTDARLGPLTKGAVSGLVNRIGGGVLRDLSFAERQAWLDKFAQRRLDRGVLKASVFRAFDFGERR